jgi:membrane protein required for colicin V production
MDVVARLQSIGWLDAVLLAVLVLSVVIGLVRGLVFEALSLAGWVAAWLAAQWAAPQAAPHVPVGTPGGALNLAAAFAVCFVGALVAWLLVSRVVRQLVRASPLSAADRALGAGFGLLRGAVLLLATATVVGLTPARESATWRESTGAAWLSAATRGMSPWLPAPLRDVLPR